MRRAQKKQAEEITELLGGVHQEIRKVLEQKQRDAATDLLMQCQKAAIGLGALIEREEGEGNAVVRLLEDYCELLYQLYERLRQGFPANAAKEYKILQKFLFRLRNGIKHEIVVRLEAVFLPYKASMWDSLESVWKAADEDPCCDAYVVPIPYYDRNPDGSLGDMHYEGELYPYYVPITGYQDYDFEARRPDLIFIHNPYDACNHVTSVHPFFYTENLKRFTERLVYIPYFIFGEADPDNAEAVESIKHFCAVPGVIHADKVIVQSEDMRQIYINVLTEAAGETTREYWEEKILGLGSPKLDKVMKMGKEEAEVPEEWRRMIRKADGSSKKIIFYNTGVGALLQNEERMLEKIRDALRVFYENRDAIALLWRPHPLMEAAIKSMKPRLWQEYQEITEQYRAQGWGIYDDTADMDRAIAVSDAYYGDYSSIVSLCSRVGMPVMIQDAGVRH